ncbi:MAG TPA: LpxD N-terminal domain-containing protein, partial [Albitalea sp.]|nr:LpxD N-terminal domain-containing protein [Albitalea sp.]
MEFSLADIAGQLGGELIGEPQTRVNRIAALEGATPSDISFLANPRYQSQLAQSQAACVIVAPAQRDA